MARPMIWAGLVDRVARPATRLFFFPTRTVLVWVAVLVGPCLHAAPGLALPRPLAAQEWSLDQAWRWSEFYRQSGLPSNVVHDFTWAGDGTPWVSTEAGIAWFDTYQWHAIGPDHGLPMARPEVLEAGNGPSEILVVVGGVVYRGDASGFERMSLQLTGGAALHVVDAIAMDDEGVLVVAANRIFQIDRAGSVTSLDAPELNPEFANLWRTHTGTIWLNARDGLYSRTERGWRRRVGGGTLGVREVREAASGEGLAYVELPLEARGLWHWSPGADPVRVAEDTFSSVQAMDMSADGRVLVAYESGRVQKRTAEGWVSVSLKPVQTHATSLSIGPQGDVWVGTDGGLFAYRHSDAQWTTYRDPADGPWNMVNDVLPDKDGSVWLATAAGLRVYHADGSTLPVTAPGPFRDGIVTGIAADPQGDLWITSGATPGAARWDGREWTVLGVEHGAPASGLHRAVADRDGRLWFLALGPVGPRQIGRGGVYHVADGRFERWAPSDNLASSRVYDLAFGRDGAMWFATYEGVSRLHEGRWTHWTTGLRTPRVFSIAVDDDDRVWFADQVSGLGRIEADTLRYVTAADGLVDNRVWEIHPDLRGDLWITTERGLSRLHEGTWTNFRSQSGLPSIRLWPLHVSDDRVLIGTREAGATALDLTEAQLAPRVVVTEPAVREGTVTVRWNAYAFWGAVPPSRLETRYRVDDGPWTEWALSRAALLEDVGPGAHAFQVQAKSPMGVFDPDGAMLSFRVPLPLYLRPVFLAPTLGLVALASLLLTALWDRRRRHQAALAASVKRYRDLFENSLLPMLTVETGQGRPIAVNRACVELFGYDSKRQFLHEFVSKKHYARVEDREAIRREVTLKGQLRTHLTELMRRDGTAFWAEVSIKSTPDGNVSEVVFLDVTDRKRAEEEREGLAAQLQQAQKMEAVGQLTGGVAHDFNNLLTVITGNLELLTERLGPDDPSSAMAASATDAAWRGAALTQRLLAFSRKQALRPQVLDLEALVVGMRDLLRRTLGETVTIDVKCEDDLGVCEVDPAQLENALLNLAINARDAMPRGGRLCIELGNRTLDAEEDGSEPGRYVRIAVSDSGVGMPEDVVSQVFEPFFTTKEVGRGTGLGLSMVYGFVKQSGGHVDIYSELGVGTTVKLYLPRQATGTGAAPAPHVNPQVEPHGSGELILVVEDDLAVRALAVTMLHRLGYRTAEADDGPTALEMIDEGLAELALLFTDVVLPGGMSGVELARHAVRRRPDLPVLFASGYTRDAIVSHGRLDRGVRLLEKPFSRADLATNVRQAIDEAISRPLTRHA